MNVSTLPTLLQRFFTDRLSLAFSIEYRVLRASTRAAQASLLGSASPCSWGERQPKAEYRHHGDRLATCHR
jgi:hypothetical protein